MFGYKCFWIRIIIQRFAHLLTIFSKYHSIYYNIKKRSSIKKKRTKNK